RHSGVGTQEWFRRCGPTISRPPSDWRESVQGLMGAHSRLRNGRSRELQAGAASSPRGRMPAGTWLPAVLLLSPARSEEHTSELQSRFDLVCRLLLEKIKS